VVDQDDIDVGLHLRLQSFVQNELACYTIKNDRSDGLVFVLQQGSKQQWIILLL
jgi:hypothetical protein